MGKTVYSYSAITHEYIGADQAQESPLEPGVYLIPANATEVPPPAIPAGHGAIWALSKWVLQKVAVVHPTNNTPPPWQPPADPAPGRAPWQARAQALARLAAYRFAIECGGVDVGGVKVKTDTESQAKIGLAFLAAQSGMISTLDFKAESGWVTLNVAQLQAVAAAVTAHVQSCYTRERQLAATIEAMGDNIAALDAFNPHLVWAE